MNGNSLISENGDLLTGTHAMRNGLLDTLGDEDLAFRIPHNPALGELVRGMGEVQQSYIDSFRTFTQDFSYRHADASVETSVDAAAEWFRQLDAVLMDTLAALPEQDIQDKTVDRQGFSPSLPVQLQIYVQAILIFYGKVSIYFRAMQKALPAQWEEWIG